MTGKIKIVHIEGTSPAGKNYRIFLDDIDISRFVLADSVNIHFGNGLPTVSMKIIGNLELPEELQAFIEVAKEEEPVK